jgi:4,5-DOPA dioxygenase extradiol
MSRCCRSRCPASTPSSSSRSVGGYARSGTRVEAPPPAWSTEFDAWAHEALEHGDLDTLSDFVHKAPAVRYAHPRTEHLAPLFVTLGAGDSSGEPLPSIIDGYWMGLSKRSIQIP